MLANSLHGKIVHEEFSKYLILFSTEELQSNRFETMMFYFDKRSWSRRGSINQLYRGTVGCICTHICDRSREACVDASWQSPAPQGPANVNRTQFPYGHAFTHTLWETDPLFTLLIPVWDDWGLKASGGTGSDVCLRWWLVNMWCFWAQVWLKPLSDEDREVCEMIVWDDREVCEMIVKCVRWWRPLVELWGHAWLSLMFLKYFSVLFLLI